MMDWNNENDSIEKSDRFITKNHWERSLSEPDLTDSKNLNKRFEIKNPHEYISVDELKYFRRKKPTDCHTKSSICLFDKDKPELPFSIFKTEYKWRYKDPLLFLRPGLSRKATSLKLEGSMDIETEHKAKYLPYNEEQILRGRPPAFRNPENLFLDGDLEHNPEYKSSFVHHPASVRRRRYSPTGTFQIHGDIEVIKEPKSITTVNMATNNNNSNRHQSKSIDCLPAGLKNDMQKCHLKLEGEMTYMPEYRSQYVPYDVEKSHSIPQLSNIHFNGIFGGLPEYQDNYKVHDNYSKSAPIKKADHLILNGQIEPFPVYRDQYKAPDKLAYQKTESLKTEDHLKPSTDPEFTKDIPEYFESFKDPNVKDQMPERGKCREPYLRLKGKLEFNPEYRSTYLDYPRSRPICKKSTSSFRVSGNNSKSPFGSPRKRFQSSSPNKYHDPNQDLPFPEQPEYRKAKYIYQIRERTPKTRQIAEVQGIVKSPKKMPLMVGGSSRFHSDNDDTKNAKGFKKRQPPPTRRRDTIIVDKANIENVAAILPKTIPKYGRRASLTRNAKNNRERSSIIECNPKYANMKSDDSSSTTGGAAAVHKDDSSFVVLNEPCKQNAWMKKSWYDN